MRVASRNYFFLGVIGLGSGSDWTVVVSPSLRARVPARGRAQHAGLVEGEKHTGFNLKHTGFNPKHTGFNPKHTGLDPTEHTGLDPKHTGLDPTEHTGLDPNVFPFFGMECIVTLSQKHFPFLFYGMVVKSSYLISLVYIH